MAAAAALSWNIGERDGCVIVTVHGRLDLGATRGLRGALQKGLAEQPAALLADLAGMSLGEEPALSVFTAIHRQAAIWPGTPFLLCGPSMEVAGLLARHRYGALQVHPAVDQAVREVVRNEVVVPMISDQLLPVTGAARHARDLATEACVRWDLPDLIGPAGVVVTELVTNAAEHANTMITLQFVRRTRYLHIAVRDGSAWPPEPRLPEGEGLDRGRGLLLVDSLAVDWGWLPTRDGKVVWATLAL
ncbi:ATP-binding protein [Actinoplanes siamensis]|uniref:ATP-binding protein n=1 Tax=Actinoplanes siamensis TaxID=1223317 RepID=A0A919N5P1_9ACTN|nr:ATP-binding protein [Actinoplanes siamensis]GIF04797.1 ATP-binding protein [Actinoplanes siamensis]